MTTEAKILAYLSAALLCAVLILGGMTYVNHMRHALDAAKVGEATQTDKAAVATGQSAAQVDAAIIADRGAQRDILLAALHEDHAHAIQAAPGASAPVDPAVAAAVRSGLCGYAAYADDPGCAGLRVGNPAQLPPAR